MSLILCIVFLMAATGKIPPEIITNEYLTIWALFSIGDAIWIGRCRS